MLTLYKDVPETVGSQAFVAMTAVAGASLFARLLRRLFGRKIGRFPEAPATGAFLIGHVSVLEWGAVLIGGMTGTAALPLSSGLRGLIGALFSPARRSPEKVFLWHLGLHRGPGDLVAGGAAGVAPLLVHVGTGAWWQLR